MFRSKVIQFKIYRPHTKTVHAPTDCFARTTKVFGRKLIIGAEFLVCWVYS